MTHVPTQSIRKVRRWLRFSLRSLLVFVTVLCIVLGIWLERARRQHEIVKAILGSGGNVEYGGEPRNEDPNATPAPAPYWHSAPYGRNLVDCVESVSIDERRLLPEVARLYGVTRLTVEDSSLCDDDLDPIQRMYGLKSIRLLGDRHGGGFSGHPGLFRIDESFFHYEAPLGDSALRKLAAHPTLEEVVIHGGEYSKAGIQKLAKLRTLRVLYVDFADGAMSRPEKNWVAPFEKLPKLVDIILLSPENWVYTESTRPWAVREEQDWWARYF